VIVTGYRDADLRAFVAAHRAAPHVRFVHNARYATTNNIVSLSLAFDALDFTRDIALIESDLVFDPAVLEALVAPGDDNLALVDRYRAGMDGTVVSVADGLIAQVFPPHLQGASFRYDDKWKTLNIYRFDRRFCRERFRPLLACYASYIDNNAYYELVLGMLVNMQRERIRAVEVHGAWAEVDDPNDLAAARFTFEPKERVRILERASGGFWSFDVTDFNYLRNFHFPTDGMMAALRDALPQLVWSYGSSQEVHDQKLAYHLLCDRRHVRALHGASQIFPMLPRLLGERPILVPKPTFGEYRRAFAGAPTYDDPFAVDLEAVVARAPTGGVVVIVNPNNPTGTLISSATIHALAGARPDLTFLVDESFLDFAREPSLLELLGGAPRTNVVVLKSLSKTLGVPGLRLGYVFTQNESLLETIDRALPIWNLSGPAEHFLELTLKFRPELAASFVRTEEDRRDLAMRLTESPAIRAVHEGRANFVLARLHGDDRRVARQITAALVERHRIYVKDVSDRIAHAPGPWLRLAVRLPEDHARLVDALEAEAPRA
jgi:histidinol-phosphate/aromatic aminotransferase/cobyric acid decarboxylase-like protein